MADPHLELRRRLEERVFTGEGHTTPELRRQAATGAGLPPDLEAYARRVREEAWAITDGDVAALSKRYDDDTLFELTVAAALGASFDRLDRGLSAIATLEGTDAA
jgi:hypothetical protein